MKKNHAGHLGIRGIVIRWKIDLHLARFVGAFFVDVGLASRSVSTDTAFGFGWIFSGRDYADEAEQKEGDDFHGNE